jgi:hypothetical protein
LASTAKVHERCIWANREHGRHQSRTRIDRCFGFRGGAGVEQGIDCNALERRLEVGLEILVEATADVGDGDTAGGWQCVGERAWLVVAAAVAAATATVSRATAFRPRLAAGWSIAR